MKTLAIAKAGLMSMSAAARFCDITRPAFRMHMLQGRIRVSDQVGRMTLFARRDVEDFKQWREEQQAARAAKCAANRAQRSA